MQTMVAVTVAQSMFPSQTALLQHVRQLLERLGHCDSVKSQDADAYAFLLALIQRHPDPERAHGVQDILVRRNGLNRKAWELCLVKESAPIEPVSWHTCVSGKARKGGRQVQKGYVFIDTDEWDM